MSSLYRELVIDALVEYSYDADISGLVYEFNNHSTGLTVSVQGYNDKLHVLLEKVLVQIRDLEIHEDRFKIVYDRISRGYRNWDYYQPYHQVGTYSRWLRSENSFMIEDLAKELGSVTVQDVQQFFPQVLAQGYIEVLSHGNLYKEEALKIADLVEKILKPLTLPPIQWPIRRSLMLPTGSNFVYERVLKDPENINHCIEYTLYLGNRMDPVLRAKQQLFAQMTDEPVFNQLRTIEQLGYVVFSGSVVAPSYAGYRILIQSEKDCRYLEGRIEHFLASFEKAIDEMNDEDFEKHKGAVISKRQEKLKNLGQEDNRFWNHIFNEAYDFTQSETDVKNLEPLTKAEMKEFYLRHISPSSPDRAKLSVHLIAQKQAKEPTLEEQKTKMAVVLQAIFEAERLTGNETALASRIEAMTSKSDIPAVISAHLKEDIKLGAEQVDKVFDEAQAALGLADAGLSGDVVPADEAMTVTGVQGGHAKEPVLITDVHAFKAGLQLSTGPRPVRNLEEFMEDAAKL